MRWREGSKEWGKDGGRGLGKEEGRKGEGRGRG